MATSPAKRVPSTMRVQSGATTPRRDLAAPAKCGVSRLSGSSVIRSAPNGSLSAGYRSLEALMTFLRRQSYSNLSVCAGRRICPAISRLIPFQEIQEQLLARIGIYPGRGAELLETTLIARQRAEARLSEDARTLRLSLRVRDRMLQHDGEKKRRKRSKCYA